jgi:hypothetical protein
VQFPANVKLKLPKAANQAEIYREERDDGIEQVTPRVFRPLEVEDKKRDPLKPGENCEYTNFAIPRRWAPKR